VLRVTFKVEPFRDCPNRREFSEKNFEARLAQMRASFETKKELTGDKPNADTYKFAGKTELRTLVNDFKNNRWFELRVISDDLSKPEIGAFLESLKIESKPPGIDIGAGAYKNLGDEISADKSVQPKAETTENKPETGVTEGIRIFFKPRANYTDAARKNNEQGVVRLRVTFLANGGIGAIETTDKVLNYGLTEEAIIAAGKIVFLPARRDNVKYSVAKIVEYSFTLY
jgi:hypothetical protein